MTADFTEPEASPEPAPGDVPPPPPPAAVEADESSNLEHVVDDLAPTLDAVAWAAGQFTKGDDGDALVARLVTAGWDADLAEEVVEQARVQTRRERGVVTRQDIATAEAARYHRATGLRWFVGFPVFSATWRLLTTLVHLGGSRRRRGN